MSSELVGIRWLLIPQLCCGIPRPVDQRPFDDLVLQDVDEWIEKDVAVCQQKR